MRYGEGRGLVILLCKNKEGLKRLDTVMFLTCSRVRRTEKWGGKDLRHIPARAVRSAAAVGQVTVGAAVIR